MRPVVRRWNEFLPCSGTRVGTRRPSSSRTVGTALSGVRLCSLTRLGPPAQDGRSALGLLYPTAVQHESCQSEHRQDRLGINPGVSRCLEGRFTQGQPARAQVGSCSGCPWATAGDRSFPVVLARKWHDACRSRGRDAAGGIMDFVSSKTARLRRRQAARRKKDKSLRKSARRVPSDRGLTTILVWQGFGSLAMTAALLAIAVVGLLASSGSGLTTAEAPLAPAQVMQRLAVTATNSAVALSGLIR